MSINRLFVNATGFLLILFLTACGSKPDNQSHFPDSTSAITASPEYYSEIGSYQVTLPIKSLEHPSQVEIETNLFDLWLSHFKSEKVDIRIRLQDYKIQEVNIPPEFQSCAKDSGFEFITNVTYSVQPLHPPAPDWDAGTGLSGDNHWIIDKLAYIGIFKTVDSYSFRRLGVPPCLSISPTPVPSLASNKPSETEISPPVLIATQTATNPQGTGGTIVFPNTNQIVNGLALDDQYVYYSLGPGDIMRQSLDKTRPFHPETFAKIQYPDPAADGSLRMMPRSLQNHWLYYVDMGDGVISDRWTVRAKNTVTLAEKVITKGNGCLLAFRVDGDTIAVNLTTTGTFGPTQDTYCVGDDLIETMQISSGQTQIIDRVLYHTGYSWGDIALSGDRLLAIKSSSGNPKSDTYLFDLKTGHSDLLSTALKQSKPLNCEFGLAISGQWTPVISPESILISII